MNELQLLLMGQHAHMLASASQQLPLQQDQVAGVPTTRLNSKRCCSESPTASSDLAALLLPEDSTHVAHHVGRPLKRLAVVIRHVKRTAPQQRTGQGPAPASQPHARADVAAAGIVAAQSPAAAAAQPTAQKAAAPGPAPAPAAPAATVDNKQTPACEVRPSAGSAGAGSLPPAQQVAAGRDLQPDAAPVVVQVAAAGVAQGQSWEPKTQQVAAAAPAAPAPAAALTAAAAAAGSSLPPLPQAAAGPDLQQGAPPAAAAAAHSSVDPAGVGGGAVKHRETVCEGAAAAAAGADEAAAAAAGAADAAAAAAGAADAVAAAAGAADAAAAAAGVADAAHQPVQLTAEAQAAAAEAALQAAAADADMPSSGPAATHGEALPAQPGVVVADAASVCGLVQLFCPGVTAVAALSPDTAGLAHNPAVTVDHPPGYELGSGLVSPKQLLTLSGLRAACAGLAPKAVSRKLLAAAEAAPPRPCRAEEGTGLAPWFWTAHQLLLQELAADVSLPAGGSKQAAGERLTAAVRARVQLSRLVTAAHQLLQQQVGAPHRQLPAPRASASRTGTAAADGVAYSAGQRQWHMRAHHSQYHQQQPHQQDIDSDEDDAEASAAVTGICAGLTLPPGPLAVAEAALHSVAAAVDGEAAAAAAAQWDPRLVTDEGGPNADKELVADAALAQGLVQLLCPAASAVLTLRKDTAGALHNHAVQADELPRYHAQDRAPLTPAQLLTRSGLKVACVGLLPNQLRSRLQQLAAAVATPPPLLPGAAAAAAAALPPAASTAGGPHALGQVQGGDAQGLLEWFWQAHSLMVAELGSPVWRASTDELPHGQRLIKVVRARVQLVQLLATAFNLLCQAHPAGVQRPGPAAAAAAAAGRSAGAARGSAPGPGGDEHRAAGAAAAGAQQADGRGAAVGAASVTPVHVRAQQGLSAEARSAAEAALASAAALLDRRAAAAAAAGWPTPAAAPGHSLAFDSDVFVADVQLTAGFVQLLCPGFCNVAALRWETAGPLHNLAVELDEPPKWPAAGSSGSSDEGGAAQQQQLHPAQLLAVSGLLAACAGLQPAAVRDKLSELAVRAAPPPDGSYPGSGLLPFFWAAHELLVLELSCYVCSRKGDSASPGQRFCQAVKARAQLAQLVLEAYALSKRGRLTAKQQRTALLLQATVPAEGGGSAQDQPPCPMQPEGVAAVLGWLEALAADPDSLQAGADTQAAAAAGGSGGAAVSQRWQPGRYQPPSAEAAAAAEAALLSAAAAAAAVARQGQSAGAGSGVEEASGQTSGNKVMLADAGAALQLLLLFYPGLLSAPALQPDAAQQLPNLPVVRDEPPKYVWGWAEWHERLPRQQLCTVSGLKLACFCIEARKLKHELNSLAGRAAAAADGQVEVGSSGAGGGGLRLWFLWVRDVLLRELQAGVWGDTGEQVPLREQLQQQVMARVQLVHLVCSAFSALQEEKEAGEEDVAA